MDHQHDAFHINERGAADHLATLHVRPENGCVQAATGVCGNWNQVMGDALAIEILLDSGGRCHGGLLTDSDAMRARPPCSKALTHYRGAGRLPYPHSPVRLSGKFAVTHTANLSIL